MKISRVVILTSLYVSLVAPGAFCQSSGFGGAFLSIGGQSAHTPHFGRGAVIPLVGVYGEWLTPRVHPGLDLRFEGGSTGVRGTLAGPRASISVAKTWIHPYGEALFGPNHADLDSSGVVIIVPGQPVPNTNRDGITIQGIAGLDMSLSQHWRWRLEFSQSRFSGIPDSHPHAVTTGIVFHLP